MRVRVDVIIPEDVQDHVDALIDNLVSLKEIDEFTWNLLKTVVNLHFVVVATILNKKNNEYLSVKYPGYTLTPKS